MVNADLVSRIISPRPTEAFTRHVFGHSGGSAGAPCLFGKTFYKHAAPTGRARLVPSYGPSPVSWDKSGRASLFPHKESATPAFGSIAPSGRIGSRTSFSAFREDAPPHFPLDICRVMRQIPRVVSPFSSSPLRTQGAFPIDVSRSRGDSQKCTAAIMHLCRVKSARRHGRNSAGFPRPFLRMSLSPLGGLPRILPVPRAER
jgi:hypothetical protein